MSPARIETQLSERFAAAGDPDVAAAQKAYMKSTLAFHGVTTPMVRAAAKELCATQPLDRVGALALADRLTQSRWFDVRSVGIAVLERHSKLLEPADLELLITLVRRTRCWAHVDWIATKLVGAVLCEHPAAREVLAVWAQDDDFWVQRTALLGQLDELRAGRGDFALFERIATPMVPEREFFLRKALGWVLRDVSKRRPELSFRFLLANRARVSGLTLREGAKHLPAPMRKQLGLALRAGGGGAKGRAPS